VLIRNKEVFARWAKMGLCYMFLGLESLDEEQLKTFRKRITPNQNFEALDIARKLNIDVAINLISDPSWGREEFERAREWATKVPEVVHLTVATVVMSLLMIWRHSANIQRLMNGTEHRLGAKPAAAAPARKAH